jgi:hypothetical protein
MVISPTKMVVFHTDLMGCFNASWDLTDLTIKHGENGRGAALCRTSKQGTAENVNPE